MKDNVFNLVGIKSGGYLLYSDNNNASRYFDNYAIEVMRRFKDKVRLYIFQDKRVLFGEYDFFQWLKECNSDFAEAIAESESVIAKWDIEDNKRVEKIIKYCVEQSIKSGKQAIIMGEEIFNIMIEGRAEIMASILNIENATIISMSAVPSLSKCLGEFDDRVKAINLNNVLFDDDWGLDDAVNE